jgi:hypothetical protein
MTSLSLAGALSREELLFVQTDQNFKFVMNVLNAIVDDNKLFALTQAFLQRNLDLVIHALKYDTELHLSIQNILSLIFCADAQFNRYYKVISQSCCPAFFFWLNSDDWFGLGVGVRCVDRRQRVGVECALCHSRPALRRPERPAFHLFDR